MVKYYEVRFNNSSRNFKNNEEAIKHAQALDKLGYCVEVLEIEKGLYETKSRVIFQTLSFNPFQFYEEFRKTLDRLGGCKYDKWQIRLYGKVLYR